MKKSQLIILEGMPSTGKTTNARFIQTQLELGNIRSKWIHEVAMPHPVLVWNDEVGFTYDKYGRFLEAHPQVADILNSLAVFRQSTVTFSLPEIDWYYREIIDEHVYQELRDAVIWNYPLAEYAKFALEKWAFFVANALKDQNEVYIIDSALFQFQIFTFLLKNRTYEELQSFVFKIVEIIQPLHPCLLFLQRETTEASIDYLENDRGTAYLEYIWRRDKDQPYYADKPPGAEGFKLFLHEYAQVVGRLFASLTINKVSLAVPDGQWSYLEDEILSYLGIKRLPISLAAPQDGVYLNELYGYVIEVKGLSITDPTQKVRRLFPKTNQEYYVDWLPTVLWFQDDSIIIQSGQVNERWTATGMVYTKIDLGCRNP
ncbi:MAG: hypothetical protein FWF06_07455 [Symbiobacteriaceae bacterium]|nr:hypothetical protein [Symbiobacteriaceae bacterium]